MWESFLNNCFSLSTVRYRSRELKRGRSILDDDKRSGRPVSDDIAVRLVVKKNRIITCKEIQNEMDIGSSATN